MNQTNESEQLDRGIAHFNAGEFFEAHEVWEALWLRATVEEKPFLQGIIQIAAAFHHLKRGNLPGAKSLLGAGLAKINKYGGTYRGIDVTGLGEQGRAWLDALATGKRPGNRRTPVIHRAGVQPVCD
jgi:uncharacterized protein